MPQYRISEVAELLGVSDDTVRRWVTSNRLPATRDSAGRQVVDGEALARFARKQTAADDTGRTSARNRLAGIVTDVAVDGLMARVDLAAGRFRLVSLMTREAAEELGLRPGVLATAVVKATTVVITTGQEHG
ncbi:molybdenum-pterin binding domain-containing protein [Micromonospora phaseoli]|uniref:Molybdenum-pterin binding domain-containing protein n=1 Tax=Micromonospora phaseoli TaxID=1144548 RepID=A0A1H7AD92_9ACTN|nr:helix-turn-helix transcriptional regulator [Micromonospora phaseoli]PZV96476.1 molybdopterin-binding protein [Micromonospora phaseoli]GIJ76164.1 MerR family transcriptional regulator [Micromonospora phaseoli]SEJ62906.1 molybdenum-pterin binding domain-containing protein [Micromonospora phaseoli]